MSVARPLRRLGHAAMLAALLVTTSQLTAQAQPRRPAAAAGAQGSKATLVTTVEGITEYSLPNGLHVLLFPDESRPTITTNVTYYVGSNQEGVGETGMAHLLEHLMFKGSENHPNMNAEVSSRGGGRNATTSFDRTNYTTTVPASEANLEWVLDVDSDRMVNALITKPQLESEFSVVRNELERGETDQFRVLLEYTMRAAFRWHGYGRNSIGTRSDIENVPIDRLQSFYRRYYQPDNALLIVAGRFEPAKALSLIENKFGKLPRPKRSLEAGNLLLAAYTVEPTQEGERTIAIRRVTDAQMFMVGYHIPGSTHPDYAAADVLSDVLGMRPSGRVYKALVDTKLAASVGGAVVVLSAPSLLLSWGQVRADQSVDTALAVAERTIEAARTSPITGEEVERAKTALLSNFRLQMNNSTAIGTLLSEWSAMGDWRMMFLHRDRIAKVTAADVQRVAAAYLKPSNRTTARFIPTAQPDRAEIPAGPSVATLLAGYKGGEVVDAGEVFDPSPKNIEARTKRATLPNGMQLTLLPKLTRGNRVLAQVLLRHGTEASLAGKSATAAMTALMLERGTTALTHQQLSDSLAKLNAQVGIFGTGNSVVASFETTRPNLLPVLDLIAQQLRSPRFNAEELDKAKKERLAIVEQQKSLPQFAANSALQKKLNPRPTGHPMYSMSGDETIADIGGVTIEGIRAFHQAYYGASYADMAVVGDFDAAQVTAAAAKLFGDWKNQQAFARIPRPYFRTDSSFESIETPDKTNAMFYAAQTIELGDDDPDYPALLVAHSLGTAGLSARISARLRGKEGLSYTSGAVLVVQSQDRFGTWTASATYAPQNVERLQQAFRGELDRALKDGFSAQEIEQYRSGYLETRTRARANDAGLVGLLVNRRYAGRTMAYDEDLEKKIAALTHDQINAALRKYIDPKRMIIVRAGDFAKNPPAKPTP